MVCDSLMAFSGSFSPGVWAPRSQSDLSGGEPCVGKSCRQFENFLMGYTPYSDDHHPGGKALGIYKFPGKGFIKLLLLAPLIVSPVAIGMGIHGTFIRLGLTNTELGVVLIHLFPGIPYGIRIFTNVFEMVGNRLEEQGKVLGANGLQVFFHLTLPTILPGVISAGSMIFIISFSQYFLTFLIGGGNVITFPLMMVPYIQSGDRMMAASYSAVFIVATLIALVAIERVLKLYYRRSSGLSGVFYTREKR